MSNALTTDRTVVADDDILASDYNNARADLHSTAEGFYDSGTPDLPSAMQVAGVHWTDPTSKALRIFRQTATGADGRAKSSPLRPVWHYSDQAGDPADDARVVEGDLLVYDDGSTSRFLKACKNVSGVRSFYGLGVRADNRTTATSGSPSQDSDKVGVRSQVYHNAATQTRDFFLRGENELENDSFAAYLTLYLQLGGSAFEVESLRVAHGRLWDDGARLCLDDGTLELMKSGVDIDDDIDDGFAGGLRTNGGYSASGDAQVVARHNHFDVRNVLATGTATVTASCLHRFDAAAGTHKALAANSGGAHAWLHENEDDTIRYVPMLDRKFMSSIYAAVATGGTPLVNSGDYRWYGSYHDGSAHDAYAYARLVMDSDDPFGHLRIGFDFDDGTFDVYEDGSLKVSGHPSATVILTQILNATGGDKDVDSIPLIHRASSWDGAAALDRAVSEQVVIDSPADADDEWTYRLVAAHDGTLLLALDQLGRIVVGEDATGVFRMDAALGTHPATTNADKTANAKTGTLKVVDASGAILGHIQLYAD